MAMKNLQSSFVQKCCFLETDLIARLEFFDYERILHRSKRKKKYKKMATILYQSFVFSSKKGGWGAGMGISWQKKFGTKKISDWKTHSRSIDFQFKISRENRVTDAYYFNLVCFCRRAV